MMKAKGIWISLKRVSQNANMYATNELLALKTLRPILQSLSWFTAITSLKIN